MHAQIMRHFREKIGKTKTGKKGNSSRSSALVLIKYFRLFLLLSELDSGV